MPSHHPRCVQHGLVVATDNMCVLCRKEARLASQPPEEPGYHLPLTAAALTAGGVVGVLRVVSLLTSVMLLMAGGAYFIKSSPPPHASLPPPAANQAAADTELPEGVGEIDSAEAADLAASLALLERAAADDREKEQAARAAAEPQPTAAEAAKPSNVGENAPKLTREPDTDAKTF